MFVLDETKVPLHPWFYTKMNHGTMLNLENGNWKKFLQHLFVAQTKQCNSVGSGARGPRFFIP